MGTIAVTGGSGQLGTLIIKRLLREPTVDAVLSLDTRPPLVASPKLSYVQVDVRSDELATYLRGCDGVIHCAFLVTQNAPPEIYRSVNIEGSKNVFRAAAAAGVPTIVYLSSILAYGSVKGHPVPIVEETPRVHQRDFPYAACKFEVEEFLDRFEVEHPDIAIARLRPNVLLGRNIPHALGGILRMGLMPAMGRAPLPIVWDEDVADLAVLALQKRARGAFNATADDLRTGQTLAKHFRMGTLDLPVWTVKAYQGIDRCLNLVGSNMAYDTSWILKTKDVTLVGSSERAKRELGWQPSCPTAVAVIKRFRETVPRRMDSRLALLLKLLNRVGRRPGVELADHAARIHLCITGPAGGDYSLLTDNGRLRVQAGWPGAPTSTIIVPSDVLRRLLAQQTDIERACRDGEVVFEGSADGRRALDWMVGTFAALQGRPSAHGVAARLLGRRLAGGTISAAPIAR